MGQQQDKDHRPDSAGGLRRTPTDLPACARSRTFRHLLNWARSMAFVPVRPRGARARARRLETQVAALVGANEIPSPVPDGTVAARFGTALRCPCRVLSI